MKKVKKVCIVFLLALLGGCSWWFNDDYTRYGDWGNGRVVAIVNDSLAVLSSTRSWSSCHEVNTFEGSWEECSYEGGYARLFLVHYREKKEPLWGDTVDGWLNAISGQLLDSVVYGFGEGLSKDIVFWKIGEKPVEKKIKNWMGDCTSPGFSYAARVRPWRNGKFLLMPENRLLGNEEYYTNPCHYGILDTATGDIEQGRFSGDDSWLAKCEDISFLDGNVICLREPADNSCGIDLIIDNKLSDSIRLDACELFGLPRRKPSFVFSGIYVFDDFYRGVDWKRNANKVYKISDGKFQLDYPEAWVTNMYFYDSLGNSIKYGSLKDSIF